MEPEITDNFNNIFKDQGITYEIKDDNRNLIYIYCEICDYVHERYIQYSYRLVDMSNKNEVRSRFIKKNSFKYPYWDCMEFPGLYDDINEFIEHTIKNDADGFVTIK